MMSWCGREKAGDGGKKLETQRRRSAGARTQRHGVEHGIDDLGTSSWRCVFVAIRFPVVQDGGGRMICGKRLLFDGAGFECTQQRMSTSRSQQCLETGLW